MNAFEEFDKIYADAIVLEDAEQFGSLFESVPFKADEDAYSEILAHFPAASLSLVPDYVFCSLRNLVIQNLAKNDFYDSLRSLIFESPVLPSNDDKKLAFLLCIMNELMPYEHVDVISMDDEDYSERREQMSDKIDRIIQLANRPFSQKTENASALLGVVESVSSAEDKTVLLAAAIDAVRQRAKQG